SRPSGSRHKRRRAAFLQRTDSRRQTAEKQQSRLGQSARHPHRYETCTNRTKRIPLNDISSAPSNIVIDARDVTLTLGDGAGAVEILRGVSLSVRSGESVAI